MLEYSLRVGIVPDPLIVSSPSSVSSHWMPSYEPLADASASSCGIAKRTTAASTTTKMAAQRVPCSLKQPESSFMMMRRSIARYNFLR